MVFALVVLAAALIGWLILIGEPTEPEITERVEPVDVPADIAGTPETDQQPEALQPPETPERGERIGDVVDRPVRNVTPPDVTQGPVVTEPLVRIAGPFNLKPVSRPEPKIERFFKPIVVSAAVIETSSGALSLAGIEAPAIDDMCPGDAASWPCGRMARAALQRFLRGRAIECHFPAVFDGFPAQLTCTVAGQDIGDWLIRHGWAKPSGDAYFETAEKAREAGLGLWGTKRPN